MYPAAQTMNQDRYLSTLPFWPASDPCDFLSRLFFLVGQCIGYFKLYGSILLLF